MEERGPFEGINPALVRGVDRLAESRLRKREAIKAGYIHQISFYGVLTDMFTDKSQYRRIDLMSNIPLTQKLFYRLHFYFAYEKPKHIYTIYLYDGNDDTIGVYDAYGET